MALTSLKREELKIRCPSPIRLLLNRCTGTKRRAACGPIGEASAQKFISGGRGYEYRKLLRVSGATKSLLGQRGKAFAMESHVISVRIFRVST
jgi:hypothetical protein